MKLKIRKEFEYSPIGSFRNCNPYTIYWVYPKTGEPYIVKGGMNDVKGVREPRYGRLMNQELVFEKVVKRIPRGWIKELNPYC